MHPNNKMGVADVQTKALVHTVSSGVRTENGCFVFCDVDATETGRGLQFGFG